MTNEPAPARTITSDYQRASLKLHFGKRAKLSLRVDVTPDGLLAIGALVSSILLSTAVIVAVAVGGKKRTALPDIHSA